MCSFYRVLERISETQLKDNKPALKIFTSNGTKDSAGEWIFAIDANSVIMFISLVIYALWSIPSHLSGVPLLYGSKCTEKQKRGHKGYPPR